MQLEIRALKEAEAEAKAEAKAATDQIRQMQSEPPKKEECSPETRL